ncbi:hypothetical protein, partial [Sedimenticola sp.]|uniref:hypothetical protein n=1 Tax=Sedimenticola sp. TaxID=1940285 RepID=UPI003D09B557
MEQRDRLLTRPPFSRTALASALAAAIAAPVAQADTFFVNNTSDAGVDSLRQAITNANNNPGPDVIEFNPSLIGLTIQPDSVIEITESLTIRDGRAIGLTLLNPAVANESLFSITGPGSATTPQVVDVLIT